MVAMRPRHAVTAIAAVSIAAFAVATALAEAPETRSMSDIQRVIARSRVDAKRCYDDGLAKNPNLTGKITIEFRIMPDGRVRDAKKSDGSLGDAAVETCIVHVIEGLRFPPDHEGPQTVRVPFAFLSTGDPVDAGAPRDGGRDAALRDH